MIVRFIYQTYLVNLIYCYAENDACALVSVHYVCRPAFRAICYLVVRCPSPTACLFAQLLDRVACKLILLIKMSC